MLEGVGSQVFSYFQMTGHFKLVNLWEAPHGKLLQVKT